MPDISFEDLLARCVERFDSDGDEALDEACAAHPEHADALRGAVATLRDFGLTGRTAGAAMPGRLGSFELVREIGRGGMGVVYEARQPELGRTVALKVLPTAWVHEPRQVARFRNEARAAAALSDPHIVRVLAVGEDEGTHFFAMHWVDGVSLRRVLLEVRGQAPPDPDARRVVVGLTAAAIDPAAGVVAWFRRAADLALQAAMALAHAHEVGILHRDIKPGNLLVEPSGHLWVTDFGLAYFARDPAELTRSGEFVGTLAYSSPEQVRGRTMVDARSDVYSLGATLYEMLTLRPPFEATDQAALIRRIADAEPPAPRGIDRRVPRALETIVLRALAKDPAHRYQAAADLADDLRAFLDGRPIRARPVTRLQRGLRWCQRSPLLATALLAIVVLLTIAAGVGWSALRAFRAERALTRLSERHLFDSRRAAAEALRRSLTAGRRTDSLRLLADATTALARLDADPGERAALRVGLRSDVLASLGLWDAVEERIAGTETEGAVLQCFAADFAHRAVRLGREILVCDASGSEVARASAPDLVRAHVFSPDAAWLMLELESTTRLWHWRSARTLDLPWPAKLHSWCFDRASRRWLGCVDGSRFVVCELADGRWSELHEVGAAWRATGAIEPDFLALAPDGSRLALSAHTESMLRILDLAGGQALREVALPDHPLAMVWSADGRQVLVGGRFQDLLTVDVEAGRIEASWPGHHAEVAALARAHAGKLVASSGWDGQVLVRENSGRPLVSLLVPAPPLQLLFTADDRALGWSLAGGDPARPSRWRLLPPAALTEIPLGDRPHSAFPWVSFHPTAALMAVSTLRSVVFVDTGTGEVLGELPARTPRRLAFVADGSLFVADTGGTGCHLLPVEVRGAEVRIGPPRSLVGLGDVREAEAQGGSLFVWDGTALRRYDLEQREAASCPAEFRHGVHLRATADGRYAALGNFRGRSVAVWDLAEGRLAFEAPVRHRSATVAFSPDGRRLVVTRCDEHHVFEVGSWSLLSTIPRHRLDALAGHASFSPDGALLALPATRSRLQVCDAHTCEPLFELDVPDGGDLSEPVFSADGSRLVLVSAHRKVFVWDLRQARLELRALGLDWSEAPIPPARSEGQPLRLRIDR